MINGTLREDRVSQLTLLQKKLGYKFKNRNYLHTALVHKSYVNEGNSDPFKTNERLEFLGDSVLDLIISNFIFQRYEHWTEGHLTKFRSSLVNEAKLCTFAKRIDLGEFLLMGKGESNTGGKNKCSLLANAFEAVVAAVFLDSDFPTVNQVVMALLRGDISDFALKRNLNDFKSQLQDYCQTHLKVNPTYHVVREIGPEHEKTFVVQVSIHQHLLGYGYGKTKKEAQAAAAEETLQILVDSQNGLGLGNQTKQSIP